MRRLMVGLVLSVLLVMALAIGTLAADWPFWHRAWRWNALGSWPESLPGPSVRIAAARGAGAPLPMATEPAAALQPIIERFARTPHTQALLVMQAGVLVHEQYGADMSPAALLSARELSAALVPLLAGAALAEGSLASLDAPVSQYLQEWRDDPRGAITLRQLAWNLSGLEQLPLQRWNPFSAHARIFFGPDFARAALAFDAGWPPGTHYAPSPADSQLLALVLERATGKPFHRYLEERLWAPIGAGAAELVADRPSGSTAAHCCLRATARDWARIGALLAASGTWQGQRVFEGSFMKELLGASPVNPARGLGVALASDGFRLSGNGRTLWVDPQRQLAIVHFSSSRESGMP